MTDQERPLCDCHEPCGCYAEGYAAARTRPTSRLRWPCRMTHAAGCGCRPCQIKRAVLETTLLASNSATLGDHDNRN